MEQIFIFSCIAGALAIIYGFITAKQVLSMSAGTKKMQEISNAIQEGASAYLKRQYYTIALVGVIIFIIIAFFFYFLWELFKANLQVAYEVITPNFRMKPGIVKVPLTVQSNLGITFLANMISLTPGTLSLDVSNDKKVLYVHSMYITNREEFIKGIKNGFEKRILEILR